VKATVDVGAKTTTQTVRALVDRAKGLLDETATVDAAGVLAEPRKYSGSVFAAIEVLLRAAALIERRAWPGKRDYKTAGQ
jgi:hypothetical protein